MNARSQRNERSVLSPKHDMEVHIIPTSQTDDDWSRLEAVPIEKTGKHRPAYPLVKETGVPAKNIGEVQFSENERVLAAVEYDGEIIVWIRNTTRQRFETGRELHVGRPCHGLEINETGTEVSVHLNDPQEKQTWMWNRENGEYRRAN